MTRRRAPPPFSKHVQFAHDVGVKAVVTTSAQPVQSMINRTPVGACASVFGHAAVDVVEHGRSRLVVQVHGLLVEDVHVHAAPARVDDQHLGEPERLCSTRAHDVRRRRAHRVGLVALLGRHAAVGVLERTKTPSRSGRCRTTARGATGTLSPLLTASLARPVAVEGAKVERPDPREARDRRRAARPRCAPTRTACRACRPMPSCPRWQTRNLASLSPFRVSSLTSCSYG